MRYHDITHDDMKNGDGLRVVLWVSGCNHQCKGCQNPLTWNPADGLEFDNAALNEILTELNKPYISGLTLSGGDPLFPLNRLPVFNLCVLVKKLYPDKTIWLYTGFSWEEIKHFKILNYIDVLVDGEYIESLRDVTCPWVGSVNQRVIDVAKSLEKGVVYQHENN